jgi:hypothetical protein
MHPRIGYDTLLQTTNQCVLILATLVILLPGVLLPVAFYYLFF